MNKQLTTIWISILCLTFVQVKAQPNSRSEYTFPDMYNVVWDSQSKDASASMPVGGGDIGLNVWVENDQLMVYAQRSGVHDEYNGFPKLGRLRLWSEPNVLKGASSFRQELKLKDGSIEITAIHPVHGSLKIKIWVEVHRPVVHIETSSSEKIEHYTQYESWRVEARSLDPNSNLGEKWSWWDIEGWPHEVVLEPDQFKQEDKGFAFYHVNPEEKLASKFAYKTAGLEQYYGQYPDPLKNLVWGGWISGDNLIFDGKHTGKYQSNDYTGWLYKTNKPTKSHDRFMVLHTSYCGSGEKWIAELKEKKQLGNAGVKDVWEKNQKWWKDFWGRSYLVLNSDTKQQKDPIWEAGRNYNLFRFMTACNAYGKNPTMFNGGLFTFDPELVKGHSAPYNPDWRRWGGGNYTLQNQRWVHWPMLKWGDSEHMQTQFDFFMRVLDVAKMRVRHNYGHDGSLFSETASVYGLTPAIHYGIDSTIHAHRERMKWMDPGLAAEFAITNHHTATLEFCYMILEYYRYTGKSISRWLPFVKSTLDFYDQHYRMRAKSYAGSEYDNNGKLVLFPTSVCENYFFTTNPVTDVSGLHAVVEGVLQLPENWIKTFFGGEKEVNRLYYTLPEIHYDTINGDVVIPPAQSMAYPNQITNNELHLAYPMFPFNQIKLGDKEMEYVYNTHKHYNTWTRLNEKPWEVFVSWTYGNVAYARMGMTLNAADLTMKKLSNGDYRFPAFWGPGYDWAPDFNWGGTGSVGLQEMLMQTIDDKIVLLPTWPKDWNANFKFHAPHNTIIEGKVVEGAIIDLKVTPESRKKDVVIWSNRFND